MPVIAMRTLFVGKACAKNIALLTRMGRRGWGSYSADNLKEARGLIAGGNFDLVLALQHLPDGSGYELEAPVAERDATLYVEIELFFEKLWIPVLAQGERVFGDRAVSAAMVEDEWEQVLLAALNGKKDGKWQKGASSPEARAAMGYPAAEISLGPTCGIVETPPPEERRISPVALLQLRCASKGLLGASRKREEPGTERGKIYREHPRRFARFARSG